MKAKSPFDLYSYLPRTNCGECGIKTCMGFATEVIEKQKVLEDCPYLLEDKYKEKYEKLVDLVKPEVKEVTIGTGDKAVRLGGEDVLYRHEKTYYNPTMLTYDVRDDLPDEELEKRLDEILGFKKFCVGQFLTIDGIAIRSVSGDPKSFTDCIRKVKERTDLPLVLCSLDPTVMEAGLDVIADRNPLIYAATPDNWRDFAGLAEKYDVPVTLFAPNDLDMLSSLAKTFAERGIEDLVLDPGTYPAGKDFEQTYNNFVKLRKASIDQGRKEIAYPLMSVPMNAWLAFDGTEAEYREVFLAATFLVNFADVMILRSTKPYALIPEVTLKFNIYTDPRSPVSVDDGLSTYGHPDENSPFFVTANFALTYYTVESDISDIDCYLMVVDTTGIGVESAVAGGQFSAKSIKDAIEKVESDLGKSLEEVVPHKTMVIPGLAARISGDTEDKTGWRVMVGPPDSGRIPGWLDKHWPPKE